MVKLKKGDILICKKRNHQSIPSIVGTELTIDESSGNNHYRLTTNHGPYERTKFGLNVCEDFNDFFEFKKYDLKPGDEVSLTKEGIDYFNNYEDLHLDCYKNSDGSFERLKLLVDDETDIPYKVIGGNWFRKKHLQLWDESIHGVNGSLNKYCNEEEKLPFKEGDEVLYKEHEDSEPVKCKIIEVDSHDKKLPYRVDKNNGYGYCWVGASKLSKVDTVEEKVDTFKKEEFYFSEGDEAMYQGPGYSEKIKCTITEVDKVDRDQTYRIDLPGRTPLWVENKYLSRIEKEDKMVFEVGDFVFHCHKIGRSFKVRHVSLVSMTYELIDLSSGISLVASHYDLSIHPWGKEIAEVKDSSAEFLIGESVMIKSSWDIASPSERRHLFTDYKSKIRLLIKESRSDSYLVQYNMHGHTTPVLKSKVERFDFEKRRYPYEKKETSLKEADPYSEKPPIEPRESSKLEFQEPVVIIKKSKKRKLYVVETSYKN